MCGIFGWVPLGGASAAQLHTRSAVLQNSLKHRGPNDAGYALFPSQAGERVLTERDESRDVPCKMLLGQTRLSIIDLSAAGYQPMFSADGRFCLVYNGEVYNYKELRTELQAAGCSFRTETDTEVVLQALVQWGAKSLHRFVGMFALALYDAQTERLFCARDAFGIKPFYWSAANGFAFASEIPALLQFPDIPRSLDASVVAGYLDLGIINCGPNTPLAAVKSLPAGHVMEIDVRGCAIGPCTRWWLPPVPEPRRMSFLDATEELRELFLDSVRLHLRSDVPLGVALSGGIDSSAVACCVRKLEPDFPIHTFSYIAADSKKCCEEQWVDIVNAHIQAISHKVFVSPQDLPQDADRLILAQGEPFGSTSIYAQYRIFQEARAAGVTVMLEGQGADELLAGYLGYPQDIFQSFVNKGQLGSALDMLRHRKEWPAPFSITSMMRAYATRKLSPEWKERLKRLLRKNSSPYLETVSRLERSTLCPDLPPTKDALRNTLANELCWFGLPGLLRHGDRNAMAFSIENRVPFCTIPLAEFCLSLPPEYLVDTRGLTKKVFRAAMRGIVPDVILDRRDKIGFATPELTWQSAMAPWFAQVFDLASDEVAATAAKEQYNLMLAGKRPFDWQVWRFANFTLWKKLVGTIAA
ncbi:MAG: Asparagine synthetase [glutamine-hydrolyzing] 3 [Desulfovibrio sp.]